MEIVVMVQQYSMIQSNPIIVICICHKMEYMNTKNVNIRYMTLTVYQLYEYVLKFLMPKKREPAELCVLNKYGEESIV